MRNRTSNNLNPHRVPNVAKYRAIAALPGTWARIVNSVSFNGPNGCWEWRATRNEGGYGIYDHHEYGRVLAHRLALHVAGRPVPIDKTVDHLCRNRACVNPEHLDVVYAGENVLRGVGAGALNKRKTHCIRGHAFSEENTAVYWTRRRSGWAGWTRTCKTCSRARYARRASSEAA